MPAMFIFNLKGVAGTPYIFTLATIGFTNSTVITKLKHFGRRKRKTTGLFFDDGLQRGDKLFTADKCERKILKTWTEKLNGFCRQFGTRELWTTHGLKPNALE